ncbi:MAG: hypothetical protein IPL50_17410 [Chitinophagaceae bacterium]|nr:hypothetical protein [Chitinophagaceae bacterium]
MIDATGVQQIEEITNGKWIFKFVADRIRQLVAEVTQQPVYRYWPG